MRGRAFLSSMSLGKDPGRRRRRAALPRPFRPRLLVQLRQRLTLRFLYRFTLRFLFPFTLRFTLRLTLRLTLLQRF